MRMTIALAGALTVTLAALPLRAGAQENGTADGLTVSPSGAAAVTSAVVPGKTWHQFSFGAAGEPSAGCQPADPDGAVCVPSSGGNSQPAGAPPWTFTLGGGAILVATDAFEYGEMFDLFDFEQPIESTSAVAASASSCGSDPAVCVADPNSSSGFFGLAKGEHSITIEPSASPAGSGSAYFRIEPIEHFMFYKVKTTKGTPKFVKFGPLTLADQFGSAEYNVLARTQLGLPANKFEEGVNDTETHLREYKLKRMSAKFLPIDVHVLNQCSSVTVTVQKPVSLMVPTNKDLVAPVAPPTDPDVDHFLCYKVKAPRLPKGLQVWVEEQFETRAYDLKKITKLCVPVAKSGTPNFLSGPAKGTPKTITPAAVNFPLIHQVCYRATIARKDLFSADCSPKDVRAGFKFFPAQPKHTRRVGVHLSNQFGSEQVDTVKPVELCIPSLKNFDL